MNERVLTTFVTAMLLASCGGTQPTPSTPAESSPEQSSAPETTSSAQATSSAASSSEEEIERFALPAPTGDIVPYAGTMEADASYEVFVYSFADSNGDGIGDLKGVEGKLDYLAELGVKNVWLTPVHPSTTYHKYNVRDYYSIDSSFGTVADFESLCAKAKQKGLKIIMDMVFNHSGRDNPWFSQAVADFVNNNTGAGSLKDLYCLAYDPAEFRGQTAYSYNYGGKDVYYIGNFDSSMPEFNLQSTIAREKHADIMNYWLNKGASGFRFDGVAYYELGDDEGCIEYCKYLEHTVHVMSPRAPLVAEYWVNNQAMLNPLAATGMTAFNFPTATSTGNSIVTARSNSGKKWSTNAQAAINGFMKASDGKVLPSFFLSNHDQDRAAGSSSQTVVETSALVYLLMPGTPYIYYGEEIMMRGYRATAATDANRRLPMQWRSDASVDTARPRPCPENDYTGKQTELGALDAIADPDSVTSFYKKVLTVRSRVEALRKGCYRTVTPADSPLLAWQIDYGTDTYYLIHNLGDDPVVVDLPKEGLIKSVLLRGEVEIEGAVANLSPLASVLLRA